ncbi:MarC family protein [Candidatus Binatia bacterium]|jgi:multiple antibiotic resistance protein|nr:MarC family protein [Candidatus Binatia bacterium]
MQTESDFGTVLQAVIALIAIANPFAAVPIFHAMVPRSDAAARRHAANRVAIAVFAILAGAVLVGGTILELFGISFAAFRAGGGLVVTLTGLDMLRSKGAESPEDGAQGAVDPLIVPLAMPLIAGPGTIITAMTMVARNSIAGRPWLVLIAIAVLAVVVWLVLVMSGWLQQRLGARGQGIVVRFMGLVLVAIGAQLVLTGIADFFALPSPAVYH